MVLFPAPAGPSMAITNFFCSASVISSDRSRFISAVGAWTASGTAGTLLRRPRTS